MASCSCCRVAGDTSRAFHLAGSRGFRSYTSHSRPELSPRNQHGPAVIFEAGLGNDSKSWRLVAGPVAAFARVVLYDRPGPGQSVAMIRKDSAITADEVAANLRELQAAAAIQAPYILVGHSLGGLYVQMFARKYPHDVSGIVLLDSSSPDASSDAPCHPRRAR